MATSRRTAPVITWAAGGLGDVPAVAALVARAFSRDFQEGWSARQIEEVLALPGSWLLLGCDRSGVPRAFALCREVAGEAELLLCAVDPLWRRQGVGLRLMHEAESNARRRGVHRLFLEVRESNHAARILYARAGFRPAGRRHAYYRSVSGQTADAITLAKDLSGSGAVTERSEIREHP